MAISKTPHEILQTQGVSSEEQLSPLMRLERNKWLCVSVAAWGISDGIRQGISPHGIIMSFAPWIEPFRKGLLL